jgi:uncharacterized protein YqfB (UPF0267 family)
VTQGYKSINSTLIRPPCGRITKAQIKAVKTQHHIILWNIMPGDFEADKKTRRLYIPSHEAFRPGDIIVLRDKAECLDNTLACIEVLSVQNIEFELINTYFNIPEETNQAHKSINSL